MASFIKQFKGRIQETWYDFEDMVYANKKKSMTFLVTLVLIVSGLTVFMLFVNTKIRASQIDYLVYENIPNKKVIPAQYHQIDSIIQEKKAVSVMFAQADDPDLETVLELITAKDKELNRHFYYYPVIYDSAEMARKYKLKEQKITFVFFQNGQEKNRFTFDSIKNPQKNFIPELNRLPMWNIKTSEN